MKVSLIGKGKTGGQLLELLPADSISAVFDSSTALELNKINQSDVAIVFIPGKAFVSLLPELLQTSTPLVIGSTGFTWKAEHLQQFGRREKEVDSWP